MQILDRDGNEVKCKTKGQNYQSTCPLCTHAVIMHCHDCVIQITGCYCTMQRKMEEQKAAEEAFNLGGIHD